MNELESIDIIIILSVIIGIAILLAFLLPLFLPIETSSFPVEPVEPHMNPLGVIFK